MGIRNVISQNKILFGSLGILILVSTIAILRFNPPKITNFFSPAKPGNFLIDAPRSIEVNSLFKVKIEVDTKNQEVNAVGVFIRYNPKEIQLVKLDTSQSFCQFYPEKKYDNDQGLISLACGSPHPGVSGKNTLMELEFMPIAVGVTTITTDPNSKILLSNGKGTNILLEFPQQQINVLTAI